MNNIAGMSTNQQNKGKSVGKIRKRLKRMPVGIDLSNLDYLEYGDVSRVAKDMALTADYVSKVKNGLCQNVEVLAALLKRGGKNKKILESASA